MVVVVVFVVVVVVLWLVLVVIVVVLIGYWWWRSGGGGGYNSCRTAIVKLVVVVVEVVHKRRATTPTITTTTNTNTTNTTKHTNRLLFLSINMVGLWLWRLCPWSDDGGGGFDSGDGFGGGKSGAWIELLLKWCLRPMDLFFFFYLDVCSLQSPISEKISKNWKKTYIFFTNAYFLRFFYIFRNGTCKELGLFCVVICASKLFI